MESTLITGFALMLVIVWSYGWALKTTIKTICTEGLTDNTKMCLIALAIMTMVSVAAIKAYAWSAEKELRKTPVAEIFNLR